MLIKAAKSDLLQVEVEEFEEALNIIEHNEKDMQRAFVAVGRSEITPDVALVLQIIQRQGIIAEKQLMSLVWRDIDSNKFDVVISTCIKIGSVLRQYRSTDGKPGIWYRWVGEKEKEI
jgi:hypothetical protein